MGHGYSHIVVGAGTVGSAAAYWLAERGAERVLVLEQFDLLHSLGSFGDHSRIIRRVYQSSDYVQLTDAMFDAWAHVEAASGLQIYTRTGGLDLAEEGSAGQRYVMRHCLTRYGATDMPTLRGTSSPHSATGSVPRQFTKRLASTHFAYST